MEWFVTDQDGAEDSGWTKYADAFDNPDPTKAPCVEPGWVAKADTEHQEKRSSFSFKVMNPPECVVTVVALDKLDKKPIEGAAVILHPYKAKTDENGIAKFEEAKGEYSLYVTEDTKYETFKSSASINGDITIKAELVVPPVQVKDF
ncbi:MAG: hypothetical protein ACRKFN_12195 [Desulfitobacterium sp.]